MGLVTFWNSSGKPIQGNTAGLWDFFGWINERHAIHLRRERGDSKPWTADPILMKYKFTNVFRQLDRGTLWLTEHIVQPHLEDHAQYLLLFNIILYRMFNWWPTGEFLGYLRSWDEERVRARLQARIDEGTQVFTGAHILRSENGIPKVTSHCRVLSVFWKDKVKLCDRLRLGRTLEAGFKVFLEYAYIGDFLAYEFMTDLGHTWILGEAPDRMTWANAGPGAQRGLLRLNPNIPRNRGGYLAGMRALLKVSPQYLASWVPALEMRDIEHSLCEFDKYWRAKNGEGRPRSTYPGEG